MINDDISTNIKYIIYDVFLSNSAFTHYLWELNLFTKKWQFLNCVKNFTWKILINITSYFVIVWRLVMSIFSCVVSIKNEVQYGESNNPRLCAHPSICIDIILPSSYLDVKLFPLILASNVKTKKEVKMENFKDK